MVDLDPRDVWRIQEKAERLGVLPGEVLRDELARKRAGRELREVVRQRVMAGMCDADIADEIGHAPGYVAELRRGMGLPANRRRRPGDAPSPVLVGERFVDKDLRHPGRVVEVIETGLRGGRVRVRVTFHPTRPTFIGQLQTMAPESLRAHYTKETP
jgi:hypothetical protein